MAAKSRCTFPDDGESVKDSASQSHRRRRERAATNVISITPGKNQGDKYTPFLPELRFDRMLARYLVDTDHPANAAHCRNGLIDAQTAAGVTGLSVHKFYKDAQRGGGIQPATKGEDGRLWYDPMRVALAAAPVTYAEQPIIDAVMQARDFDLKTRRMLAEGVLNTAKLAYGNAREAIERMQQVLDAFCKRAGATASRDDFERLCAMYNDFFTAWDWDVQWNEPKRRAGSRWQQ